MLAALVIVECEYGPHADSRYSPRESVSVVIEATVADARQAIDKDDGSIDVNDISDVLFRFGEPCLDTSLMRHTLDITAKTAISCNSLVARPLVP